MQSPGDIVSEHPRYTDFHSYRPFSLINWTTLPGNLFLSLYIPVCLMLMAWSPGIVRGGENQTVSVGRFSMMSPGTRVSGWEPMTFRKIKSHTRYVLVEENGRTVLKADSRASASGLIYELDIDPADYPLLVWNWKVSNTMAKGDVSQKSGDDYAARIYVTFADDPKRLTIFQRAGMRAIKMLYGKKPPSAALVYIWGNRADVGTVHPNPFTDRLQMIVVESGPTHVNRWRSAQRDIFKDFRRAFGTNPPHISGIAIMTDTDNTGESATAWFGDIILKRRTDE